MKMTIFLAAMVLIAGSYSVQAKNSVPKHKPAKTSKPIIKPVKGPRGNCGTCW